MNLTSVGCRWNHDEAELFYQRKETSTARMTQNSVAPIFFKWSESTSYVIVERELPFVCLFVCFCMPTSLYEHTPVLTPMNCFARVTILFVWAFLFKRFLWNQSVKKSNRCIRLLNVISASLVLCTTTSVFLFILHRGGLDKLYIWGQTLSFCIDIIKHFFFLSKLYL